MQEMMNDNAELTTEENSGDILPVVLNEEVQPEEQEKSELDKLKEELSAVTYDIKVGMGSRYGSYSIMAVGKNVTYAFSFGEADMDGHIHIIGIDVWEKICKLASFSEIIAYTADVLLCGILSVNCEYALACGICNDKFSADDLNARSIGGTAFDPVTAYRRKEYTLVRPTLFVEYESRSEEFFQADIGSVGKSAYHLYIGEIVIALVNEAENIVISAC